MSKNYFPEKSMSIESTLMQSMSIFFNNFDIDKLNVDAIDISIFK